MLEALTSVPASHLGIALLFGSVIGLGVTARDGAIAGMAAIIALLFAGMAVAWPAGVGVGMKAMAVVAVVTAVGRLGDRAVTA